MPETCENWLGLVNSRVNYTRQTRDIYQALPYPVDFKAPEELWNQLGKTVNVVLFGTKDLYTSEKIVKLESNLYVNM